jgi:hypothetical protein
MKKNQNKNKNKLMLTLKIAVTAITWAKILGALTTIIIVALIKYIISGSFHIEYCDFSNNVLIGLLGWTVNTSLTGILTEYLNIKGLNLNLYQIFFGKDSIKMGGESLSDINKPKYKLYNAMESDDELDGNKRINKGKGVDKEVHPFYTGSIGPDKGTPEGDTLPMDKGKQTSSAIEPPFSTWSRIFPGVDPASVFFPKKINPGPGFNVPGGEVPIRDDICQHIDYNSHVLNQFKQMDLETAVSQRNNYLTRIRVIDSKLDYAKEAFSRVPVIPTTEYEFKLKNQIIYDLETMNKEKIRSEARAVLLNSRIEFIEIQINKNQSN